MAAGGSPRQIGSWWAYRRIWMDRLLKAIIEAVEHIGDTATTERYRTIRAAAERERGRGVAELTRT